MNAKWIGAVLVTVSCGGFGFSIAASCRREEQMLRQILSVLNYMECELQYRLTPLPELCRQAARETKGGVREVLSRLAWELERQTAPDVLGCMTTALAEGKELPRRVGDIFLQMGHSLGRFDLPGQLKGLESVRESCRRALEELGKNRDARLRSYKTLGLCAGAALAILFL